MILGAVSYSGLTAEVERIARLKPVIAAVNDIDDSGITAKASVPWSEMGAAAGLVGMPQLLGSSHSYGLDFPTGLGFPGIAIALLGRNSPIGIAFAALLWAFLDNSSNSLEFEGVPKQAVLIMQGVIVLSVVIAYELVRRYRIRSVARDVGRQLAVTAPEKEAVA